MSELYTNPLSTDDIDYIEAFLEVSARADLLNFYGKYM